MQHEQAHFGANSNSLQWTGGSPRLESGSPGNRLWIQDLLEIILATSFGGVGAGGTLTAIEVSFLMREAPKLRRRLRFGVFDVDLQAGELRKHGLRIRLQEQPFEVLAMLLEHPGEVVTREELQKKLWPADTFVDFKQSTRSGKR